MRGGHAVGGQRGRTAFGGTDGGGNRGCVEGTRRTTAAVPGDADLVGVALAIRGNPYAKMNNHACCRVGEHMQRM
jgi:hypothetical protein